MFTKKPAPSLLSRVPQGQPKPAGVTVTTTVTRVAVPVKKPPPPVRPQPVASSSKASSRPSSSSSSAAAKRKSAPAAKKKEERPPKARKPSVPKVEQRVLPEAESSSDDSDDGAGDARDRTPQDEEHVVQRSVAGPSGSSLRQDAWAGLITSDTVVQAVQNKYRPYFKPDPEHPDPVTITLEYPSAGASETFMLLTPKTNEEYNPIQEVSRVITVVLENFVPLCEPAATPSPFPNDSAIRPSTSTASSPAPLSAASSPSGMMTSQPTENAQILRLLQRSIASNVLSLPLFLQAVNRYNALVVRCRDNGEIRRKIEAMPGLKSDIWQLITDQTYQRVVGPSVPVLKDYQPFSSNVYGELMPSFLSLLIGQTGLTPESVLVDLGSGVGNCCLQAALQVGCETWGWEMMAGASRLAREQLDEARRRWAMWGLCAGRVEIREDDFCASAEVGEVLKKADVVICNNYAFKPELNERLSLFFLELKDGARVVSLRRFVPQDFRLNERNCSSPGAIIRTEAHRFPNQAVSWTHEGGEYFVQTVDRSMLRAYQAKAARREGKKRAREAEADEEGEETETGKGQAKGKAAKKKKASGKGTAKAQAQEAEEKAEESSELSELSDEDE